MRIITSIATIVFLFVLNHSLAQPNWTVSGSSFENSMNIIGFISYNGEESSNAFNKIGAFVGDECRGVADMTYVASKSRYYAFLTVYGNESETISFKVYYAENGIVYENFATITFSINQILGTPSDPYELNIIDVPVDGETNYSDFCEGEVAQLTASSNSIAYMWNTGATTRSININQDGSYSCTRTLPDHSRIIDRWVVSFHEIPNVNLGSDRNLCVGSDLTLDAGNNDATYYWNTGDHTQSIRVSSGGIYHVTVTSTYGCTDTDEITITEVPVPEIDLGENQTLCENSSIVLDAENESSSYLWNTGEQSQTILVENEGTYQVEVTNAYGCKNMDEVDIIQSPTRSYSMFYEKCKGDSILLDAETVHATAYQWDDDDNGSSKWVNQNTIQMCTITLDDGCTITANFEAEFHPYPVLALNDTFMACEGEIIAIDASNMGTFFHWKDGSTDSHLEIGSPGNYWVEVENQIGCATRDSFVVVFHERPQVDLGDDQLICPNQEVVLDAQNEGASYVWNTGETTSTITISDSGKYKVNVSNNWGCMGSDSVKLSIASDEFVYVDKSTCQGDSILLNAHEPNASTYSWRNGNTNDHQYSLATGMDTCTIELQSGCIVKKVFTSNFYSNPHVELLDTTFICQGDSCLFKIDNHFKNYRWSTNDTSQSINLKAPGDYFVEVENEFGCVTKKSFTLLNHLLPEFELGEDQYLCTGDSIWLKVEDSGIEYIWNTGSDQPKIIVKEGGKYQLTTTNSNGCSYSDSIYITEVEAPKISLNDYHIQECYNQPLTLCMANNDLQYVWSTGDSCSSIIPMVSDTYHVVASNQFGCLASDSTLVILSPKERNLIQKTIYNGQTYDFFGMELNKQGTYCFLDTLSDCPKEIVLNLEVVDQEVVYGKLNGSLSTENNQAIEGATILLQSAETLQSLSTQSFSNGHFSFEFVQPGKYYVCALVSHLKMPDAQVDTYYSQALDWEHASEIRIGEDSITNIEFILTPSDLVWNLSPSNGLGTICGNIQFAYLQHGETGIYRTMNQQETPVDIQKSNRVLLYQLINNEPIFFQSILSDEKGNYQFSNLPFNAYRVQVEIPGITQRDTVDLNLSSSTDALEANFLVEANFPVKTSSIKNETAIKIYPNPAKEVIYVEANFKDPFSITIRNVLGKKVMEAKSINVAQMIDVSSFNRGLYFMEILGDHFHKTEKIIIE